jgi:hypothetical protein
MTDVEPDDLGALPPEMYFAFAAARTRQAPPELWPRIERRLRRQRRLRAALALAAGLLLWGLIQFALRPRREPPAPHELGGPFGQLALALRDDVHRPTLVERSPELGLLRALERGDDR